jgi:hypothetical protein
MFSVLCEIAWEVICLWDRCSSAERRANTGFSPCLRYEPIYKIAYIKLCLAKLRPSRIPLTVVEYGFSGCLNSNHRILTEQIATRTKGPDKQHEQAEHEVSLTRKSRRKGISHCGSLPCRYNHSTRLFPADGVKLQS